MCLGKVYSWDYSRFLKQSSSPCSLEHVSLGALGDSFYEYLLKSWLMTSKNDVDARDMYYEAVEVNISELFAVQLQTTVFTHMNTWTGCLLVGSLKLTKQFLKYPQLFLKAPTIAWHKYQVYAVPISRHWIGTLWNRRAVVWHMSLTWEMAKQTERCNIWWVLYPFTRVP